MKPWLRQTAKKTRNRVTGPKRHEMKQIAGVFKNEPSDMPIPGARMAVAAFPVKMTDDSGAKRHPLCRPASPGAIIAKAISDSGRDAEWLRVELGWKKRYFADVLADRECLGILEALAIGRVLGRADLKLISAAVACERWDEEELEMAKERR